MLLHKTSYDTGISHARMKSKDDYLISNNDDPSCSCDCANRQIKWLSTPGSHFLLLKSWFIVDTLMFHLLPLWSKIKYDLKKNQIFESSRLSTADCCAEHKTITNVAYKSGKLETMTRKNPMGKWLHGVPVLLDMCHLRKSPNGINWC